METLYTYTVRKNGYIVFSSKPMTEEKALSEAVKYPEVDVEEFERYYGQNDSYIPDHQC